MIKQNYLTALDIQTWKARMPLAGARPASPYQTFQLMENDSIIGILMLDNAKNILGYEGKIATLLDSMLAAISLRRTELLGNNIEINRILVMGGELAKTLWPDFKGPLASCGKYSIAATYHPLDLLQQPGYKRQAWSDLQIIAKNWLNKSF